MMKNGRRIHSVLLMVSNMGKFTVSVSNTSNAKPTGLVISVSGTANGPIFATYAATVDDQMSITHTYFPHVTNESMAKEYFGKFKEVLTLLMEDAL